MKKYIMFIVILVFIILVMLIIDKKYTNDYLKNIDYKNIITKTTNNNSFILYVSNKSCTYCDYFEPKLKDVANEYKIIVYKIDTATLTTDEYNELTDMTGPIPTPTVLFFYDGKESGTTNRISGNVEKNKIIKILTTNNYIKD